MNFDPVQIGRQRHLLRHDCRAIECYSLCRVKKDDTPLIIDGHQGREKELLAAIEMRSQQLAAIGQLLEVMGNFLRVAQ